MGTTKTSKKTMPVFTLLQLGQSVAHSDQVDARVNPLQMHNILEIGLKKVGLAALGQEVAVDLGNGYVMVCRSKTGGAGAKA